MCAGVCDDVLENFPSRMRKLRYQFIAPLWSAEMGGPKRIKKSCGIPLAHNRTREQTPRTNAQPAVWLEAGRRGANLHSPGNDQYIRLGPSMCAKMLACCGGRSFRPIPHRRLNSECKERFHERCSITHPQRLSHPDPPYCRE